MLMDEIFVVENLNILEPKVARIRLLASVPYTVYYKLCEWHNYFN